jgi:hypothetical protein
MKKIHALAIALLLAVAAGLGLAAATKTAGLRTTTATAPSAATAVAARSHKLDRVEAALHRALRDKPPALPPLPAGRAPAVAAAPQLVYRRPAPIVVLKQRSQRGAEHEYEGGGDD